MPIETCQCQFHLAMAEHCQTGLPVTGTDITFHIQMERGGLGLFVIRQGSPTMVLFCISMPPHLWYHYRSSWSMHIDSSSLAT
jgi:hypothetical protein